MKKRMMLDLRKVQETAKVARALSSPLRLQILALLIKKSCHISEIAQTFAQPVSSVANHIRVLEDAGLVTTSERPGVRGSQKVCGIAFDSVTVHAVAPETSSEQRFVQRMGIGSYFDCAVEAPCGVISEKAYLGTEDQPSAFYSEERMHAQLLWFRTGFVEYRFPLPEGVTDVETVTRLVFSMEVCSEAPGYDNQWPSDIELHVNGQRLGLVRSQGDFGGSPGSLNPAWWPQSRTQFGMLHHVELNAEGCFIDGVKVPGAGTLADYWQAAPFVAFRLGVSPDAEHVGGMNLFGEKFGNHPQGVQLEVYQARVSQNEGTTGEVRLEADEATGCFEVNE